MSDQPIGKITSKLEELENDIDEQEKILTPAKGGGFCSKNKGIIAIGCLVSVLVIVVIVMYFVKIRQHKQDLSVMNAELDSYKSRDTESREQISKMESSIATLRDENKQLQTKPPIQPTRNKVSILKRPDEPPSVTKKPRSTQQTFEIGEVTDEPRVTELTPQKQIKAIIAKTANQRHDDLVSSAVVEAIEDTTQEDGKSYAQQLVGKTDTTKIKEKYDELKNDHSEDETNKDEIDVSSLIK